MIKMYISNNRSSRNARKFFKEHAIPFYQIQLKEKLSEKEIRTIIEKNPDEMSSILSLKSKEVKDLMTYYEDMRLSDFIKILIQHPQYLKTPIIYDERRFLAGYNQEDIRAFIPRV